MSARHQMAGLIMTGQRFATLSNLDMQQCPKMFCNFVQKVLAKNNDKLQHNKGLSTSTLNDLCRILHCELSDIAEYIEDN